MDEKKSVNASPLVDQHVVPVVEGAHNQAIKTTGLTEAELESHEVFKKTTDGVEFRTVSWQRATFLFLKITFSLGVLSIPTALSSLGAVGGALSLVGWQALNTYCTIIQGNFRNRHPECHSLVDMGHKIGGLWLKEVIGIVFLIAYILVTGSGIIGLSVAFNALSDHAACTVWWALLSAVVVTGFASIRTLKNMGWLTFVGFVSLFVAILVVVVGVTTLDRPAAAPQTGADFDLGFVAIAYPTFAAGMAATATIFISSAGSSAFLPVISEMRHPRDYKKAVYICMALVLACYLSFTLVVYRWCGIWVANPALGSAGDTLKKVSYGIALIGLIASGSINQHIAAKYIFVRLLRNSPHLQSNTVTHWVTWMGCSVGIGAIAFILAESIAIFSYILSLAGSVCFAPMALVMPGFLYLHDYAAYRRGNLIQKTKYLLHVLLIVLGCFITVGGTYATVVLINEAYASGEIGSAFSCADNSGTVV
ncbi:transmembrane amino acid transporter protein-domain-containing protein [Xylariomycetidae sp. FL2044]|nr:transmembrane amino acid transporter protein-domain-containing protein [Xylariomycetidae sp. FL2044]